MDLTVQAMSGVMACTGFDDRPPVKSGAALCDFFGAVHLYGAAVSALFDAQRSGKGRFVEVSMLEAVYPTLSSPLGLYHSLGKRIHRARAIVTADWRSHRTTFTRRPTAGSHCSA